MQLVYDGGARLAVPFAGNSACGANCLGLEESLDAAPITSFVSS